MLKFGEYLTVVSVCVIIQALFGIESNIFGGMITFAAGMLAMFIGEFLETE